jgi:hypothetical protein
MAYGRKELETGRIVHRLSRNAKRPPLLTLAKGFADCAANSDQTFARVNLTFGLSMSTLLADEQLFVAGSKLGCIDFPGLPRRAYLDR